MDLLPVASSLFSLDDLIRPVQNRLRNRQADLLGGLQIDHKLELRRLFHGKIGGLGAFQNLVHVTAARAY